MNEWLKEQYGLLSFKIVSSGNFPRKIEWPAMLKWLDVQQDERILDVACGRGGLTLRVNDKNRARSVGVDLFPQSMKWAKLEAERKRCDCAFVAGNAQQLPFRDACFDKVVCSSALEHFDKDVDALREMNRVLKPGGILVLTVDSLTVPIDDEWRARHQETFYVQNYYSKQSLAAKLAEAGFRVVESEYLMRSNVARYFFKRAIALHHSLLLASLNVLIAYPLVATAERLSRSSDAGLSLIAKAKKESLPSNRLREGAGDSVLATLP
ncbi:MAG: class I SAM-dependent methyltransferase [Halobacteriota archaeon]